MFLVDMFSSVNAFLAGLTFTHAVICVGIVSVLVFAWALWNNRADKEELF